MRSLLTALLLLIAALPAQAQTPANAFPVPFALAGPLEQTGAQATPDTTTPWRYFPLHVGNVWEYEESNGRIQRYFISKDTLISGQRYFKQVREVYRSDFSLGQIYSLYIRYDTTLSRGIQGYSQPDTYSEFYETPCALDVSADTLHECTYSRFYVRRLYNAPLVFGDGAGYGMDTVRTSVKSFASLMEYRYAAGIGLIYFEVEGSLRVLSYYYVNGVEHGRRRIVVPAEPEPSPRQNLIVEAVYPIPFRDRLYVRLRASPAQAVRTAAFDALGRQVTIQEDWVGAPLKTIEIPGAALSSGSYLIRMCAASGRCKTVPVVKVP